MGYMYFFNLIKSFELFKSNFILSASKPCCRDHPGQGREEEEPKKGKKKKGGGQKTVSSFYTIQLNALMTTLHATEPHFIR